MSLVQIAKEAADVLTPVAVGTVTGVIAWLGHRFSSWFKHKTGIDVDKRVTAVLDRGIAYAEEAARKYVKFHGKAWTDEAKRNAAVLYVTAKLKALRLPTFARDMIEHMIEARLNELRDEAGNVRTGDATTPLPELRVLS